MLAKDRAASRHPRHDAQARRIPLLAMEENRSRARDSGSDGAARREQVAQFAFSTEDGARLYRYR